MALFLFNGMKKFILIVAAGKGTRFRGKMPKQFELLAGKPLIVHTVSALLKYGDDLSFFFVFDPQNMMFGKHLIRERFPELNAEFFSGGENRTDSVRKGVINIPDGALVAVHDAVRPFVSVNLLKEGFLIAQKKGAAVPVVPVVSALRKQEKNLFYALDDGDYAEVQTPQFFQSDLLKKAFGSVSISFRDEASLVEHAGFPVAFFRGERMNFKITYPEDIKMAVALIQSQKRPD